MVHILPVFASSSAFWCGITRSLFYGLFLFLLGVNKAVIAIKRIRKMLTGGRLKTIPTKLTIKMKEKRILWRRKNVCVSHSDIVPCMGIFC